MAGTFILPAGGFEKFIFLIERGYPRSIKKPLPKAEGVVKISDFVPPTTPATSQPDLAVALGSTRQQVSTAESNALLMKGEYIPDILSGDAERAAYREAVERYKKGLGIPANVNVPKDILDGIAEDIKDGMKPVDAADNAPEPPDKGLIKKGRPKVEPK